MNLYLISQTESRGYETFDSAVVAAESEEDARTIHPGDTLHGRGGWEDDGYSYSWVERGKVDRVAVELIGVAMHQDRGVICASFNAG